jgi:transposase
MLYEWRKLSQKEGDDAIRGNGNHPAIAAELALLRRENEVLKMEREILKKAAEFWVKERQ